METLNAALLKIGRPSATSESLKKSLEDAGFVDIHTFDLKQPFGPWARNVRLKRIGAMVRLACGFLAFARNTSANQPSGSRCCSTAKQVRPGREKEKNVRRRGG